MHPKFTTHEHEYAFTKIVINIKENNQQLNTFINNLNEIDFIHYTSTNV